MNNKDILSFGNACKSFLLTESLNKLRTYGRSIGVDTPTTWKKTDLVEQIVGILTGEIASIPISKRGAPVKDDNVDTRILMEIEKIRSIYLFDIFPQEIKEKESKEVCEYKNVLLLESSSKELFRNADRVEKVTGQLQEIDDVCYLLPLDCINREKPIIIHKADVIKNHLREGDVLSCLACEGDAAYIVGQVETINNVSISKYYRNRFEDCTPCNPHYPLNTYNGEEAAALSCKYLSFLLPLQRGYRCCFISPPKMGKTYILQELTNAIKVQNTDVKVLALLVEQAPENVTAFQSVLGKENVVYTTYEDSVEKQVFAAEFLLKRAKRFVENKQDVVLFVDSFNALAKAYNETDDSTGGKTLVCGLESKTLQYVKQYFGNARCFSEGGSLTIIGTLSVSTGNPADDIIASEISQISTYEVRLNEEMARKHIYPALDVSQIYVKQAGNEWDVSRREILNKILAEYLPRFGAEKLLKDVAEAEDGGDFAFKIRTNLSK